MFRVSVLHGVPIKYFCNNLFIHPPTRGQAGDESPSGTLNEQSGKVFVSITPNSLMQIDLIVSGWRKVSLQYLMVSLRRCWSCCCCSVTPLESPSHKHLIKERITEDVDQQLQQTQSRHKGRGATVKGERQRDCETKVDTVEEIFAIMTHRS